MKNCIHKFIQANVCRNYKDVSEGFNIIIIVMIIMIMIIMIIAIFYRVFSRGEAKLNTSVRR